MKITYAFLTKDSFRIEVKASNEKAAYNKLMDIPFCAEKLTKSWIKYDKDGLASLHDYKVTF